MDHILQWTEDLKTDNEIIDTQHKVLFDLINDINNAFKTKTSFMVIDTMFTILTSYAFDHFELEESLLLDKKNRLQHCYEHYDLIRSLHSYIHMFRNSKIPDVEPAIFLSDWLFTHISTYDIPALMDSPTEAIGALQLESDEALPEQSYEVDQSELRAFKRLPSNHVSDEKIIGHCFNASKLKNSTVIIENLSSGGLNITDSHTLHDIGDLVVISASIGKNFRMKERLVVKNRQGTSFGLEFFAPSSGTKEFLAQLYGSVKMGSFDLRHDS